MNAKPWVALVGDYDPSVVAHQAIPRALELAAERLGVALPHRWIGTDTLDGKLSRLEDAAGIWCVPASPYRRADRAIAAIRQARERNIPFLGTCGGFQHVILEVASSVWGILDATHAELDPGSGTAVIVPLTCALVEKRGGVRFKAGSRVAKAYGKPDSVEGYHCSYGLSRVCARHLAAGPLRASAWDEADDVRAVELEGHPFFVATLFQPERAALKGEAPPLVVAFAAAVTRPANCQ